MNKPKHLKTTRNHRNWFRKLYAPVLYLLTARYALPGRFRERLLLTGISEADLAKTLERIRTESQWKEAWKAYAAGLLRQLEALNRQDGRQDGAFAATLLKRAAAGLYLSQWLLPWGSDEKEVLLQTGRELYRRSIAVGPRSVRAVQIEAHGEKLSGYLDLPEGGRGPGVLLLAPVGASKEEMFFLSEPFARAGFVVLRIDLPGSGESSGVLSLDAEKFCSGALDDLLKRSEVSSSRVVALGISLGAYWMVKTMAVDDRIAGGIGVSIPAFHQEEWDRLDQSFWIRLQQCFRQPTVEATRVIATQMTLYGVIDRVRQPLLAFHGGRDGVTHRDTARLLREHAVGPLELHVYPGEGHGCLGQFRNKIIPRMLDWSHELLAH